ncbi:MAG: alpha/beta hydrolase [Lapillicoccus sp.]
MSPDQDGFRIELPEGNLDVHDLSVGTPDADAPVVVGVHGITANGLSWVSVAEEVSRRRGPGSVRFLAPDLRGRGSSRSAPGPYGLTVHADDLLAIADVFGTRPVLVGHSMGAFVVAVAAARAPHRVSAAVLVDGGFAFPAPPDLDIDALLTAVIGPAMQRLTMRFDGPDAYLGFWRDHPAIGPLLQGPRGPEVRRYLLHDLVPAPEGHGWASSCVLDAVRADGADVLTSPEAHTAAAKAAAAAVPVELVWAERGLMDEAQGLFDDARLAALALPESVRVTGVAGANHYSVVIADAGVAAVVDAVERALDPS